MIWSKVLGAFGSLGSKYYFRFAEALSKHSTIFLTESTFMPTIVIRSNGVVKIHLHMILVPIWASQPLGNPGLTIINRIFESHVSLKVLAQILEPYYDITCRKPC